jgi:hypothetical protein
MRELRSLFHQREHAHPQRPAPQNIWEGDYFRDLDTHVEEENRRLQEMVRDLHGAQRHPEPPRPRSTFQSLRDEMLAELDRLRAIMTGEEGQNPTTRPLQHRNRSLLYAILDEMGAHVSLVKQVIFIHKTWGMFQISLNDSDVHFTPSSCLRCEFRCMSRKRHICIVREYSTNDGCCVVRDDESNEGWIDPGLTPIDLLILSKAVALENNMIPMHVINQIKNSFGCHFTDGAQQKMIQEVRNLMLQEFNLPPKLFPAIPPRNRLRTPIRPLLLQELRTLFRRARRRNEL